MSPTPPTDVPDPFPLGDVNNATEGIEYDATNCPVEITGAAFVSAPISLSGDASAQYKINDGGWTSAGGTIYDGDLLYVHMTAGAGLTTCTVTIGDAEPEDFNITLTP